MSDAGDDISVDAPAAEAPKGKLSQVLKNALVHDCLARGWTSARGQYIKLIYALCTEHKIDLINVGDVKVLGTWAGLCKIDREDNLRKIVGCSCVVVKDYGVESEGLHVLLHYFEKR
ncbi:hypothetical protein C0995_008336 [Termitomyces sp. Mi166|nr:hypothetical protein C0995_008336 [Termitomyces sp. Mi166\